MPTKKPGRKNTSITSARKAGNKRSAKKPAAKQRSRQAFTAVSDDATISNLNKIDHIVVLLMENRSFDQMLGYLKLEAGRTDIDGLSAGLSNTHNGKTFPIHHFTSTILTDEQDPCHSGACVAEQVGNNNGGFVKSYATHNAGDPNPATVMGYYNAGDVPAYDHLAKEFCVCDRWFASVPGATWPNRLYALAGRADKSKENKRVPLYSLPSFVRHLDVKKVSWKWYAHERVLFSKLTTLRLCDDQYRNKGNHKFFQGDFFDDVKEGKLPAVSWIDPNFVDFGGTFEANDDHPPADVMAGQELALKVYNALVRGPQWSKTMLVIAYDEHGGFYDHVAPPAAEDDDPNFRGYGVRVPAIVVSPFAGRGSSSHVTYDHTSIIKSILLRFCRNANGQIPDMGKRVNAASHLGGVLTEAAARPATPVSAYQSVIDKIADWHKKKFSDSMKLSRNGHRPHQLNEFQQGLFEARKRLARLEAAGKRP
ncbi:MAG: alkaline phosphatase family protein [Blastocatellia bacterium]